MTTEEIRELISLVNETGVSELEVERGGNRVRICARSSVTTQFVAPQVAMAAPVAAPAAREAEPAPTKRPEDLTLVKSPIPGTFYQSASPDAPPFVKVGDRVSKGTVLCIIESMKLMNEIEAEVAGIVEARLVENQQAVEYGEALFGIRPL